MITPTFFISFSNFIRTVKRNRHDTRGHGGILSIRAPCIRTLPAEPAYAYGRTSAADACGTLRNDTQDFCPAAVRAVSYSGSVPSGTVFTPYKNNDFPRYCQTYRKILSTNFEHSRPVQGSVRFPARTPECGRTDGKNRATESLSPHNTRTVRGGRRRGQEGSRPHSPNAPVTPPNHAAPIARAPVIQRVSAGRLSGTESSETPRRPTVRCGYGSGGCAPQVFARPPRFLVRPAPQFRRRQYPIRPGSARRRSNTSAPIGERSLRETFASRRQIPAARNTHATACTRPQHPAEAKPAKTFAPHNGRPASIWVGSRNKRSASRRPSCGTGGPHPPSPRCNGGWDTPSR